MNDYRNKTTQTTYKKNYTNCRGKSKPTQRCKDSVCWRGLPANRVMLLLIKLNHTQCNRTFICYICNIKLALY